MLLKLSEKLVSLRNIAVTLTYTKSLPLWPSGGFIKTLQWRADERIQKEQERELAGRKKMKGKQDVTAHWGINASSYCPLPMKTLQFFSS